MKRLFILNGILAVVSFTALAMSIFVYVSRPKIAYVNNTTLLNEYNGVKEGQRLFEEKLDTWKANLDTLETEINGHIEQYQRNYAEMSDSERQRTETYIKQKQERYFDYKENIESNAEEEDYRMTTQVVNQMNSQLVEHGKEQDYDLIIGVTEAGNVLYANEGMDITETVLTELNESYEGE